MYVSLQVIAPRRRNFISKFTDPKSEHEYFTTKEKQDRQKSVRLCVDIYTYTYILLHIYIHHYIVFYNKTESKATKGYKSSKDSAAVGVSAG